VKICADELYPASFDELLFSLPDVIDYQVTLSNNGDQDILTFKIEIARQDENSAKAIDEALSGHPLIRKNLIAGVLVLSPVELASPGTLTRLNRAKKLISDKRFPTLDG
jgi:phenylacetate-coenzyme A ligase PaaK-like adenylate-forming protein